MYNDNNKKLRTIFLVLAIVLVLLRIIRIAKAEGLESYAEDYLDEYIETYFPSDVVSIYESNKQYYYSFVTYTIDNDCHVVDILPIPNSGITLYREGYSELNTYSMGVSCYTNRKSYRNAIYTPDNVTGLSLPKYGFRFVAYSNGIGVGRTSVSLTSSFNDWMQYGFNWLVGPEGSNANCFSMLYTFGQYTYISASPVITDIVGYAPSDTDVYCDFNKVTTFVPSYTEDSRLKFAKIQDTFEGVVLMTDIRKFVKDFPIQDTSHSSVNLVPESITLTYTVDGTEKIIVLDSSNSSIRSKYIFETPIYEFDFDDEDASVVIIKADFTISGTSQSSPYEASETYKVLTNYFIKSSNPLPIPTPISNPEYDNPEVIDASDVLSEITAQLMNNSTSTNAFTGEWTLDQEHPTVPSWADNYDFRIIKSDFNSIISGVVNADIYNYYTSNDPNNLDWITGGFNPRNFVDENRNFAFYDMIIISVYEANIAWDPDNVGNNLIYQNIHLLGYITLYSQRYYVHKSSITENNILASIELSAMNDVAFYETVKAQIDQFEEYTLGRMDLQLDIEKDGLSWLETIDNSIKNIDFPIFDDTSILSGIGNIVSALSGNNDDIGVNGRLDRLINFFVANDAPPNPSALTYRNWLDGLDTSETRRVTHFGTNIYTLVKNIFDIFDADYTEDPSFENPDKDYLGIASDFIDALNNPDNDNKFFRGFFDRSFDPLEQSGLPEE